MQILRYYKNSYIQKYFFFSFSGIFLQLNRIFQTAILLRIVSENNFAIWIYLLSFVSFFTILDLGIPTYFGNKLFLSKNNKIRFLENLKKIFSLEFFVIFIIILTSFFTFFYAIYNSNYENTDLSKFSFLFLYITFVILIIGQVISSFNFIIFRSIEKQSIFLNISNFVYLVQTLFLFFGVINNNINFLSILFTFPIFFSSLIFRYYLINKYQIAIFSKINFNLNEIKGSWYMTLITISNILFINLPIVFVNKYISSSTLVVFFLYRTLSNSIVTFNKYLPTSLWTNLTNLEFDTQNKIKLIHKINIYNNLILISIMAICIIFGELIINLWTGYNDFDENIFSLLILLGLVKCFYTLPSIYFQSTNIIKSFSFIYFFSSTLLILPFFFNELFKYILNYLLFLILIESIVCILSNFIFIFKFKLKLKEAIQYLAINFFPLIIYSFLIYYN